MLRGGPHTLAHFLPLSCQGLTILQDPVHIAVVTTNLSTLPWLLDQERAERLAQQTHAEEPQERREERESAEAACVYLHRGREMAVLQGETASYLAHDLDGNVLLLLGLHMTKDPEPTGTDESLA